MGMTLVQKILQPFTGGSRPEPGDFLIARTSAVMITEGLGPTYFEEEFRLLGNRVFDGDRIVVVIDHYSPAATIKQAEVNRYTREWAAAQGIERLYANCGPNPQIMSEEGFFQPGTVVAGNDSHTCTGGAFGTLSLGVGTTSIACAAATGKVWVRVPESVKVTWEGELSPFVTPKDMALFAIGQFGSNRMIYKAVEYEGSCIDSLSMAGRMVLSNMAVEMGAKIGIMAPDAKTHTFLKRRSEDAIWDLRADEDAEYEEEFRWDAKALEPMIAVPHHVSNVRTVRDMAGTKVDQAYVGSCTGGRYEDIEAAANLLRGRKIAPGVNLIVCPASKWIWEKAARDGVLADLSEAGAAVSYPSCGPCGAAQGGLLAKGEVCISATNRNFKGRMGSTEAEVYLASPVTVAASALAGEIIDPRDL